MVAYEISYNGVNVNDLHSIYLGFMLAIFSLYIYLGFRVKSTPHMLRSVQCNKNGPRGRRMLRKEISLVR